MLLFSLINVWLAWNLYRPMYKPMGMLLLSGFSAIFLSELAIHFVLIELILMLLVVDWSNLAGASDFVSLALLCVAWVAMLVHYYLGTEIGPTMEAALQRELGPEVQSRNSGDRTTDRQSPSTFLRLCCPFSYKSRDVVRVKDIAFYVSEEYSLALDVYHHRNMPKNAPVLLNIHGGGWLSGTKEQQSRPLMTYLAERGWVCVSINYRLSPEYTFPAHLIDCKRGLAWIRKYVFEYGGNPDFVAVSGGSTGGNLSALMALTQNRADLLADFAEIDTSVNACVSLYGVHDFSNDLNLSHVDLVDDAGPRIMGAKIDELPEVYRLASPVAQIHENAPPFMVVHSETDNFTSSPEAEKFSELLRDVSRAPVVFAKLPLTHHGFDTFWSLRSLLALDKIERFLSFVYYDYLAAQTQSASAAPSS